MKLPSTPFRWPTTDGLAVTVHAVADDIVLGTLDGEDRANAWDATTGLTLVRDDDRPSALDLDARPAAGSAERPYTVVFHVDGDYGVETFVQEVVATGPGTAYDLGVEKAREDGGTSSGRTLSSSDWDNASEIGVFVGHGLDGYGRD
jgi:hypothetical protein